MNEEMVQSGLVQKRRINLNLLLKVASENFLELNNHYEQTQMLAELIQDLKALELVSPAPTAQHIEYLLSKQTSALAAMLTAIRTYTIKQQPQPRQLTPIRETCESKLGSSSVPPSAPELNYSISKGGVAGSRYSVSPEKYILQSNDNFPTEKMLFRSDLLSRDSEPASKQQIAENDEPAMIKLTSAEKIQYQEGKLEGGISGPPLPDAGKHLANKVLDEPARHPAAESKIKGFEISSFHKELDFSQKKTSLKLLQVKNAEKDKSMPQIFKKLRIRSEECGPNEKAPSNDSERPNGSSDR